MDKLNPAKISRVVRAKIFFIWFPRSWLMVKT